jgi:hypothetical protein
VVPRRQHCVGSDYGGNYITAPLRQALYFLAQYSTSWVIFFVLYIEYKLQSK